MQTMLQAHGSHAGQQFYGVRGKGIVSCRQNIIEGQLQKDVRGLGHACCFSELVYFYIAWNVGEQAKQKPLRFLS